MLTLKPTHCVSCVNDRAYISKPRSLTISFLIRVIRYCFGIRTIGSHYANSTMMQRSNQKNAWDIQKKLVQMDGR